MKALRVDGANLTVTHPRSVAGTRLLAPREVTALRGEVSKTEVYETAWEPTTEELFMLNAGGSVRVVTIGSLPPMALRTWLAKPETPEDESRGQLEALQRVVENLQRGLSEIPLNFALDSISWFVGRIIFALHCRKANPEEINGIVQAGLKRGGEYQREVFIDQKVPVPADDPVMPQS